MGTSMVTVACTPVKLGVSVGVSKEVAEICSLM